MFYFTNTTQKPFGCTIFPLLRPYNNHKFAFRSTPCVYLGPSPSHLGSRCLNLSNDRVYIARHVVFNPSLFLYRSHIEASQAPKDSSNFPWLHIKSVPLLSTGFVGNSGQTSTPSNIPLFSTTDQSLNNSLLSAQSPPLTTPLSSHSPIPQQSPSSYSTTDPPLSLIVDLTHYPTQLNVASSTSTSPPQIHLMQLRSSTMQKRHACLSTKAKNYLITEPQTFTQAKPYAE